MWRVTDVEPNKNYRLCLRCKNGVRRVDLVSAEVDQTDGECILLTEIVPRDLLIKRDIFAIAKATRLTSGEPFFFDAHGIWLAKSEYDAMSRRVPLDQISWITGTRPRFAPK